MTEIRVPTIGARYLESALTRTTEVVRRMSSAQIAGTAMMVTRARLMVVTRLVNATM